VLILVRVGKAQWLAVGEWIDDAQGEGLSCEVRPVEDELRAPFARNLAGTEAGQLPVERPAAGDAGLRVKRAEFEPPIVIGDSMLCGNRS